MPTTLVTKINSRRLKILMKMKQKSTNKSAIKLLGKNIGEYIFKSQSWEGLSKQTPTLIPQRKILTDLAYLKNLKSCV